MSTVIRFEHVSKRFRLNHHSRTLQELLLAPFRRGQVEEEFWPLRDISFTVEQGETVGIIGPNGVGKSTILKLIARILEPTSGTITTRGRIGTLLELGAGFHPDLTGRENIYLNGAVLGMSKEEITRKFDSIVAFAELGPFIDMPVKHYSSGMYVRLGFAIAIHAEPDILLVDEVLAVGDAAFQQKSAEKIMTFRREGRTIVFVSHDMQMMTTLCERLIWLREGMIYQDDRTENVWRAYLTSMEQRTSQRLEVENYQRSLKEPGEGPLAITSVVMTGEDGRPRWSFQSGERVHIRIRYEAKRAFSKPVFSILIHRADGLYVSSTNTYNIDPTPIQIEAGRGELAVEINSLDLYQGDYLLSAAVYAEPQPPYWMHPLVFLDRQFAFRVTTPWGSHGVIVLPAQWHHTVLEEKI